MSLIYSPQEDSYLLEKVILEKVPKLVKKNPKLRFLEIGSGSGIQLNASKNAGIKKDNIFSVDLNNDAIEHCRSLGFRCIRSDLFQFVDEKYDIIVFNPPYLPESEDNEDKGSRLITTGGKLGSEIINRFLEDAGSHLKDDGRIFLLISSLTKGISWKGYEKKLVAEEKLFFERLYVYELIKK